MEETVTVFVRGLEFYGFHGVPAEERVIGHRYVVDLDFAVSTAATETDRVEDSVDYGAAAQRVVRLGQSERFSTVERLARVLADDLLEAFPAVVSVRIRVAKKLPPAPVIAELAGVELVRSRSSVKHIA